MLLKPPRIWGGFFLYVGYLSDQFRIPSLSKAFTFTQSEYSFFLSKSKSRKYSLIFLDIISRKIL